MLKSSTVEVHVVLASCVLLEVLGCRYTMAQFS